MLSPLPRRSGWVVDFARYPSHVSLARKGCRVGLRIVLFEACSAFTRVTACTLALPPIRGTHSEGFSYFVTSIAAPVASGWSGCRGGLAPTGKRRLCTAHTRYGHRTRSVSGAGCAAFLTPVRSQSGRVWAFEPRIPVTHAETRLHHGLGWRGDSVAAQGTCSAGGPDAAYRRAYVLDR